MKIRIGIVVAWFVLLGLVGVFVMTRSDPEKHANILEHYKYGSIGAEGRSGVPASLWLALPEVFEDLLPKGPGTGYERVGLLYEDNKRSRSGVENRPIGTSFREAQTGMIGLNCAVCHVGTLRTSKDARRQIILGMPANQFNLQAYLNFLRNVGGDKRFNADTLIPAIKKADPDFSRADELLYRHYVIPRTKAALQQLRDDFKWMDVRPPEGPGRVDTFNPYKVIVGISTGDTVGTSDLPSIWNQRPREGMQLHWDGNNDSVEERNISAAIGAGATEASLDHGGLQRVADWIWDFQPPMQYPRDRIDAARAEVGRGIYAARCASCHDFGAANIGQSVPLAQIGTDPERLHSFTPELAANMNTFGTGRPWRFSHFRKTDGYANMPLDGLWLRAPYLHNGSVPTLRDLLEPPERRPTVFWRGYTVYDYQNVGFVSSGPEAERLGWRHDTGVRGNGNGGHVYGTGLTPEEKAALLEFMKTL